MASNTETDEQYKQICDDDSCDRVLCENTPIMCYMNKEEGDKTLCQMCYDGGYKEDDENPDNFESDDSDSDTDSEDKREGDWYIVRHEMCTYDTEGEITGMDIIYEEEFDHLRDAREMYNEIKVKPYGELVYLDMITCDGSDQDNIDCRGTMKKE